MARTIHGSPQRNLTTAVTIPQDGDVSNPMRNEAVVQAILDNCLTLNNRITAGGGGTATGTIADGSIGTCLLYTSPSPRD